MEITRNLVLIASTVTLGMMCGLFTSFSYAIMPALKRTDDRTFVHAMQRISVAILNGWFAVGFGGALVFTAIAAVLHLGDPALPWIVAALVLYAATLAVTFVLHVPLNNALVAAGDPDGIADLAAVRAGFEPVWVRYNVVRSLTSTAALACAAVALIQAG
ncbi:anthrone oxygenase family protein [Spirillospora sp. NPDC047279]|uniref:anthrone oxygenase family protein n=1 Tax=Spirillospora sp. NPDC047279 TaxID=3155478 RepID=UPI0033E35F02